MKTRDMVPNQVGFLANSFVAHHVAEVQKEVPNSYADMMNMAVQRFARAQAVNHFAQKLYDAIQRNLTMGHESRIEFYDTMDFSLNQMDFVSRADRVYFNRQDYKCEGKVKGWKAWDEICTKVHRRLNGKTVTHDDVDYRIVKRRETLFLTKLED